MRRSLLLLLGLAGCGGAVAAPDPGAAAASAQALTASGPLGSESYLGEDGLTAISFDGDNSVAYAQVPGHTNDFLGRYYDGANWGVARYKMDWKKNHLGFEGYALAPGTGIALGNTVRTGYDPTIVEYGGQLWAAFECGGDGMYGASACVGPYDPDTGSIDAARTSVPLDGASDHAGDAYSYSASVPKLLAFQGKLYVYWTVVKQLNQGDVWTSLTSRGAQLDLDAKGRMWVAGTTGTISAVDPNHTVEVWGLGADSRSNLTADMQGVFTDGQHVFATAGLGGDADGQQCLRPLVGNDGCYRLAVSRSFSPLGPGIFQYGDRLADDQLVSNSQNYTRRFIRPDGSQNLMSAIYGVYPGEAHPVKGGFFSYGIPADATYFQPGPARAGTVRRTVESDALTAMDADCAPSLSQACDTAASRLCRTRYGFEAGFGPVQIGVGQADVVCVGSDVAVRQQKSFTELSTYVSQCASGDAAGSIFCHAAVDQLCQHAGFESGLSIEEASAADASFVCVRASGGQRFAEPWSTLEDRFADCKLDAQAQGFICLPAADTECRSQGFVSGFGAQEMSQRDGQILCLGE